MSQYFTHYTDAALSLVGFGLFAAVFFGSLIWTGLTANKKSYETIASEILKDGENS